MITKTIKIDNQDFINLIESLHYEVNARKELLAFMLNNNMRIDTDAYKRYNQEYLELYIQYIEAKNKFEQEYVRAAEENPISWTLDFSSGNVIIKCDE